MLSALRSDSPAVRKIKTAANDFIVILFNDPAVFQEDFTYMNIPEHFVQFYLAAGGSFDYDWFDGIVAIIKAADDADGTTRGMDVFVNVLMSLAQKSSAKTISTCMALIGTISDFISNKDIRIALANSRSFGPILKKIMSQTVFPNNSEERCAEFFGKDPEKIQRSKLNVLNTAMTGRYKYHELINYLDNFDKALNESENMKKHYPSVDMTKYIKVNKFNDNVQMADFLVEKPLFIKHDLVSCKNIFEKKFEMILCRNVLIYFNHDLQNKVITFFYENLTKNGCLVIGRHEGIIGTIGTNFEKKESVYFRKKTF